MKTTIGLTAGGVLLTVYASMYPLTGWHDTGAGVFDFLQAPWPRHVTGFDLATNVLAYAPLGFLWFSLLRARLPAPSAFLLALVAGFSLSLSMETLQNFLPNRVSSNLDLASNFLGSLLGALVGLRWRHLAAGGGRLENAWRRLAAEGRNIDQGMIVMGLWLLAQVSPSGLLFSGGELRQMFGFDPAQTFSAERFTLLEALIATTGILVAGVMAALLLRRRRRAAALALLGAGLLAKTLGMGMIEGPALALAWMTPGALRGLAAGLLLLLVAALLRASLQRALAAMGLLLLTAMTNLMPDNPYLASGLPAFPAAQWLHFNGLTRLAGALWPFVALAWLMSLHPDE